MNPYEFLQSVIMSDGVFTEDTIAFGVHLKGDKHMCLSGTTLPDQPLLYLSLDSVFDALNMAQKKFPDASLTYSTYNFDELAEIGCSVVFVDGIPWIMEY